MGRTPSIAAARLGPDGERDPLVSRGFLNPVDPGPGPLESGGTELRDFVALGHRHTELRFPFIGAINIPYSERMAEGSRYQGQTEPELRRSVPSLRTIARAKNASTPALNPMKWRLVDA